jgi:hypothetical protein
MNAVERRSGEMSSEDVSHRDLLYFMFHFYNYIIITISHSLDCAYEGLQVATCTNYWQYVV